MNRLLIILILCLSTQLSQATSYSYLQSPSAGGTGFGSSPSGIQSADDFVFAQTAKVTSIRWWGTYTNNPPTGSDTFTIRFFGAQGEGPQLNPTNVFPSLVVTRSDSGLVDSGHDKIYRYETQLPSGVILSAGATAYLSVLNGATNPWYWQTSSSSNYHWFRDSGGDGTWFTTSTGNLAFELIGTTPPAGDYNFDFAVDQSDYQIWRQNFGSSSQLSADGNKNNVVDAADYVIWRKTRDGTSAVGSEQSVPEPVTIAHAIAAAVALGLRCGCRNLPSYLASARELPRRGQ